MPEIIELQIPRHPTVTAEIAVALVGAPGPAGGATLITVGASPISGHTAVAMDADGLLIYADCTNPAHIGAVLGVVANAYGAGDLAVVQTDFELVHAGWSFAPGPVLAGLSGALVQTLPPGALFAQVVGFALAPTRIRIDVQPPIVELPSGDTLPATAGMSDAPSDGKTYGRKDAAWAEVVAGGGGASITNVAYADLASLRSNTTGTHALVDGLGLFQHVVGSDEPDDDESCFATASGRWLLQAAHWDLVDAWQLPEVEDEPLRFASSFASKVLTGPATCAITSVADVSSASFTGTITGAAVGDRVIATPPAQLGADAGSTGRLSYHAFVSAANTVTVVLTNASAAAANTNAAIRAAWPITVIKA